MPNYIKGKEVKVRALNAPGKLRLIYHDKVSTPMTWNSPQPVILLPTQALDWSADEMEMILRHELMHTQRKDFWVHLLHSSMHL